MHARCSWPWSQAGAACSARQQREEFDMTFISGIIGIGLLATFLGIMLWWAPAVPLIIIVVGVLILLIYDFVQTLRHGENSSNR
jgi:hypothetical protein